MLKAFFARLLGLDAAETRKDARTRYVTPEQLELALEEHSKHLEWEWNEWYEKFNKLHLRLSKRAAREKVQPPEDEEIFEDAPQTSVLHYRRPWSV